MNRAVVLVLVGVVSVQVGAAFAKDLFDEVSPTGMVWLRLATSTLVLLLVARPSLRGRTRDDWLTMVAFGLTLGLMNWAIYQSFARIPLGIAVTIEFVGPLGVALVGSRRVRDLLWVGLAGLGVVLLGLERADLDPVGVAFALLAGAAWATYILLSQRTGARWAGLDGLALASLVGMLLLTPFVLASGEGSLLDPRILLIGLVVGLMSSVLPYSCELVALRTLPSSTFGILMSLEPAVAALAAIVVLGELLAPTQWAAVACVIVAVAGATASSARAIPPAPAQ
ncbi:EamA family transporter [uncultured Nocardioides sp.]|uniref:EamA family transporter n=1 Tax=uncultured Nocardioides sp. TaxID=198441 RepID=UPI002609991F|nr:EamA family transporter [uncultured Nocardioides sp.]